MAQRARFAPGAEVADRRFGYPLGVLYARGDLAGEHDAIPTRVAESRHDAGIIYRSVHDALWGPRDPQVSNLGNLAAARVSLSSNDDTLLRSIERLSAAGEAALRTRYSRFLSALGANIGLHTLVDQIVLVENWDLLRRINSGQLQWLRAGLSSLASVRWL